MRRSASQIIRNLEMRIARLERQANPFSNPWSEEAFSKLVLADISPRPNDGYSARILNEKGDIMFAMTLDMDNKGNEKISWTASTMTKMEIQEWGEALKKKLRASSPVEAWIAIIEGANEGDLLSSPDVLRRAKNSLR